MEELPCLVRGLMTQQKYWSIPQVFYWVPLSPFRIQFVAFQLEMSNPWLATWSRQLVQHSATFFQIQANFKANVCVSHWLSRPLSRDIVLAAVLIGADDSSCLVLLMWTDFWDYCNVTGAQRLQDQDTSTWTACHCFTSTAILCSLVLTWTFCFTWINTW